MTLLPLKKSVNLYQDGTVIAYRAELDANLQALRNQLLAHDVDVGHYHFFTVHDPKERIICAASFPERVLHHAVMNVCEPLQVHLRAIRGFLASELALELKDNVQINRCDRGLPFLGYRVFPGRLALGPRARQRFARRLRGYEAEWRDGAWSEDELARRTEALLSYVRFADTVALRRRIVGRASKAS